MKVALTVLPSVHRDAFSVGSGVITQPALLPTQPHTQPRSQHGIRFVLIPFLLLICDGLRSKFW